MTIRGKETWGPVLMMGLLQSAMIACLPWLIERTGISAGGWSVILSVGMMPVLVGAPWWGRLVDRRGAHWVSVRASVMVLGGYALVLLVLAGGTQGLLAAIGLLIARLAHGIGAGGLFPAAQRLAIAGVDPKGWGYRLSRLQVAVHAGRLAGPALVALAAWLGMMPVLLLAGVLAIGLAAGRRPAVGDGPSKLAPAPGARELRLPWTPGWPLYAMALLTTLWIGATQFVLGPLLTRLAGVPPEAGSSLTAAALVLTSLVGLAGGPLVHGRVRSTNMLILLWGGALLAAGGVLGIADSVPAVFTGLGLLALGAAILTPWYGSCLRQCHPQAHGEVAGRLTSTHTLGYIVGTLLGGCLLEMGLDQPLAVLVALAPLLVLLALVGRRLPAEVV